MRRIGLNPRYTEAVNVVVTLEGASISAILLEMLPFLGKRRFNAAKLFGNIGRKRRQQNLCGFMFQKTLVMATLGLILSACSSGKPRILGQFIKIEGETAFLQTPKNTTIKLPVQVKDVAALEKSKKNKGKCYSYTPDGDADPNKRYIDIKCKDIGMTTFGEDDGYVDVLDRVEKSGDMTTIRFADKGEDFIVNSPTYEGLRAKTGGCFRYSDNRASDGGRTLVELEDIKCQNLQSRRAGNSEDGGDDAFIFDSGGGSSAFRLPSGRFPSRSSSATRSSGSSSRVSSGSSFSRSSSSFSGGRSGFGSSSSGSSSS